MECLIRANLHYLQQATELLDRIDDACLAEPSTCFYESSIGGHLRHCLEHYLSFLEGMESGRVDYDARKRDVILETQAGAAREKVGEIIAALEGLEGRDLGERLEVKMDCGESEIPWQASTPGRELQFLVSHTVHHFAMIGGICTSMGVEMGEVFGVAPSTIRHRVEIEAV
jgi:uncharacterized damage-inducible protein DinB